MQIWEWVKGFCEATGVSGQLCFDFMLDSTDGRMYPFECNPRTSTILLNFYDQDHVAQAFFNAKVTAINQRMLFFAYTQQGVLRSDGSPCQQMLFMQTVCIVHLQQAASFPLEKGEC